MLMILPFIVIFIFLVFICFANLKSSVENVKLLEKLLFVPIATAYSLLIKWNYINFTNALINNEFDVFLFTIYPIPKG